MHELEMKVEEGASVLSVENSVLLFFFWGGVEHATRNTE